MLRQAVVVVASVSIASSAFAGQCEDNFTTEGSFFSGKTYKTSAQLASVKQPDAYKRAYVFTTENGFTITSSDKDIGVISANQTVSYGKGKTVPLNISVQPDGNGTRISLTYATSGGVTSPEDAIKRHFCLTVAAAEAGKH